MLITRVRELVGLHRPTEGLHQVKDSLIDNFIAEYGWALSHRT